MMKDLLTFKVLLGMGAVAALFLVLTLAVFFVRQPDPVPGVESVDAVMTIIPAPTRTRQPAASPTVAPFLQTTSTALPGEIAVGVFVQISGTEGAGLRLRAAPSLSAAPLFLGEDDEVYRVVDGPVEADGQTWWKLTAPYDASRTGWAVQLYLLVIPRHNRGSEDR